MKPRDTAEGAREASPESRAEEPARDDEEERAARVPPAERADVLDEPSFEWPHGALRAVRCRGIGMSRPREYMSMDSLSRRTTGAIAEGERCLARYHVAAVEEEIDRLHPAGQ